MLNDADKFPLRGLIPVGLTLCFLFLYWSLLLQAKPWPDFPSSTAAGVNSFAVGSSTPYSGSQVVRPSANDVGRAIGLSADYLGHACGPDGRFAYLVDLNTGEQSGKYNIVRHAGAIYSLAFYNRLHPDKNTVAAMVRAGSFLCKNYLRDDPGGRMRVVWPEPVGTTPVDRASLGAAGLGLVALSEIERASPNTISYSDLEGIARFLVSQQKSDGSFFTEYCVATGPVQGQKELANLYFPGEAILGLLSLYEVDHEKQWLVAAGKGIAYLAGSRVGQYTVPPDHWALIATAKFLPYYEQSECPTTRREIQHHTVQVLNTFLARLAPRIPTDPTLDGSVNGEGRTAPTATSLEGLLAALESAPGAEYPDGLTGAARDAVYRGVGFLLRAQLQAGPYAGGMPGHIRGGSARPAPADANAAQIRIDYVQHALCAFLRYEKLSIE
jgi:hypothetical protein